MRKIIFALLFAALPGLAAASGGEVHLDRAPVDLHDTASLQRGAKLFVNYCLSCHSAAAERYNRMGRDLGLTDEQVEKNLMLASEKVGDPMTVAMRKADAKEWFGAPPPDLSVIARARGADYLYTYLRTFYLDDTRPFGVNNAAFPGASMPHVLWELQGLQEPVYETVTHGEETTQVVKGYEVVVPGKMTPAEYDQAVLDLTNFLVYLGEPVQLERQRLGIWVLAFLVLFFFVSYALKKEYWKDVH